MPAVVATLPLRGAGGEPVDLRRTLLAHGLVDLPPNVLDPGGAWLETVVPVPRGRPRVVRVEGGPASGEVGTAVVRVAGRPPGRAAAAALTGAVARMLRLDQDLSGFYARVAGDPELAWAARGAGRMPRSPTVFEDLVKTICTTNCAWSATVRMVGALVGHLGEAAAGVAGRRAFPTPAAMAGADAAFYRDVVRAGYRGPYLRSIAAAVADGSLDLAALEDPGLDDDTVAEALLALPGVGPYACAHMLMLLGRHSRLVLDSWTRPTYARLVGRPRTDAQILRAFRRYGPWANLAFWLMLTRGWVPDTET